MPTLPHLVIGYSHTARIAVQPLHRENPQAQDYWDGNWLVTDIEVAVGSFKGRVQAALCAPDFHRFREELQRLQKELSGTASFSTMEEWLALTFTGDGIGHFKVVGHLIDSPGVGNTLSFELTCDQTELPPMLHGLDAICTAFPVLGEPAG